MWRRRAACTGMSRDNFDLFVPTGTPGAATAAYNRAKRICAACPVADDCYQYAVDEGIVYGVWGGTTPNERGHRADRPTSQYGLGAADDDNDSSWTPSPSDLWLNPQPDWELYDFTFSKEALEQTAAARKHRSAVLARIDAELAELDQLEKESA